MSAQGEIRYDPVTGAVAIRTNQPDESGPFVMSLAWLVATQTQGAHYVQSSTVADWVVLEAPQ